MSRSGGIKPWPAVFQRKRNAAYLLRPCLPLATYPFTTIWIPWKAFLANYTAAAGARVPDNTPRLASVSLGERVISSTSVALPGHTNRGPVTRIEPWEEYHGMTRVSEFRHGIHGIHAFSTTESHSINLPRMLREIAAGENWPPGIATRPPPLGTSRDSRVARGFVSILTFERANNGWIEKCRVISSEKFIHDQLLYRSIPIFSDLPFLFEHVCADTYSNIWCNCRLHTSMVR